MQSRDPISFNAFIIAAKSGDLKTVQQYIEENKDNPDAINRRYIPYLDPDRREYHAHHGDTALSAASEKGRIEIVKTLLTVPGINIDVRVYHDYTAFTIAVFQNQIEVASTLLTTPSIRKDPQHLQEALSIAVLRDSIPMVTMLLKAGADPKKDKYGKELFISNDAIRDLVKLSPPIAELKAFQTKRAILAALPTADDAQKKKDQQERMQLLLKLSVDSAVSDIDFISEHKASIDDFSFLPDLILRFSNLIASLTEDDKKLDDYSRTLMKLAAAQGHETAKIGFFSLEITPEITPLTEHQASLAKGFVGF